jgi:hypothetical protein
MKGIKKKNLTLDRGWSTVTWTQKSNRFERLKLLKDDGVDITSLKGGKLSSADITRAVLARAAAPSPAADDRTHTSGAEEGVKEAAVAPTSDPMVVHNNNRPHGPIVRKRARDDAPEVEVSHDSHGTTEPGLKKSCRKNIRTKERIKDHVEIMDEEELIMDWDILKRQILKEIFPADHTTAEDSSRITINFPSQSGKVAVSRSLELNSKGYDKIMEELNVLSDSTDEEGNFELRDEYSNIRVITNQPLCTIIEGPFHAVMGLFERLRQSGKGLVHMAKRYFDDAGVRQAEGIVYELSVKTQWELEQTKGALVAGRDAGDAEVQVRWVWDPVKAAAWPDKLY